MKRGRILLPYRSVKVNIRVRVDVWRDAREMARVSGKTLTRIVEDALIFELAKRKARG